MSEQDKPETRAEATRRWNREGRKGETDVFRDRVRAECQAKGMPKPEAHHQAWIAAMAAHPPEGVDPVEVSVPEVVADTGQVQGLGCIPPEWPVLPGNASIQAELAWVQAERLGVITTAASGATVVKLADARAPAPSRAALGWLETSIRSYAKYVDVVSRVLKDEVDEQLHIRRERLAIGDIEGVLAEMQVV